MPPNDGSDLTRRQYILNLVLLVLALPGFLFGVVSLISWLLGSSEAFVGMVSGLGVQLFYILAFWLSRRGQVRLAGYIPVLILFLIMTGSTLQQGIGHSTMIGYAMTVLTAGILIGIYPALVFTILSTIAYLLSGMAQAAGRIPAAVSPEVTVVLDSAALGFGLVVIIAFFWVNSREMDRALVRERQLIAELKNTQEQLEQRVDERTSDLKSRALQIQAAAEVGRAAVTIRDLNELLTKVTHLISARFGFYHVGIFLLDKRNEYAVLHAANSQGGQRMLKRGHKLRVGEVGIVGYVTGKREPRIALDVGEDAVYFDNPDLPETRSEMALPLVIGDILLGALDVQSRHAGAFTTDDISTLEVLADQLAVAIENARLLREMQEALETAQRAYGDISAEGWKNIVGQRVSWGYRYDVEAPEPVTSISDPWDPEIDQAIASRQVIQDNQRILLPLRIRDQIIGVLNLERGGADQHWTEEEISLIEPLADRLSQALESARLFEDTQRRAARERTISEFTGRVRETLDMDLVLKTAVEELRQRLGLSEVLVRLVDEPEDETIA